MVGPVRTMSDLLRLTRAELLKLGKHALTWGLLLALLFILGIKVRGLYTDVRDLPDEVLDLIQSQTVIDLDPATFDAYVGAYDLAEPPGTATVMHADGRFLVRLSGEIAGDTPLELELLSTSETAFVTDVGYQVHFVAGEGSAFDRLVLTYDGRTFPPAVRREGSGPAADVPGAWIVSTMSVGQGISPRELVRAATLPGLFEQIDAMVDWLVLATILLAIVAVGREFDWGTMRAVLARGVRRGQFALAKLVALAAVAILYLLVLWVACALMGLWTTRALAGESGLSFLDGAFVRSQLGLLARASLILLSFCAFALAFNLWAGKPGPAFTLLFLLHFASLLAYILLPMGAGFFFVDASETSPEAFGNSIWGRAFALVPHYNSRIVAHWAEPPRLAEIDNWARNMALLFGLPTDPWRAAIVLLLYGFVPLLAAVHLFKRRGMMV